MVSATHNQRDADINIVGLGVKGIEHVTRECESACRRSTEILAVANLPAVLTYLRSLCPRVTDLHPLSYEEDENRLKAYDTMSAMVLAAALEHAPVTFATYGHPLIYVYPTRQIVDAAPYLGLTVRVLAGISSLDTMLIDLGLDPAMNGLQMYEATDLLVKQRPLQPDVPCLLWQVGAIETVLYSTAPSRPQRFRRIRNYLLQIYPPDHELSAVYSSHHPLLDSSIIKFKLADMESRFEDLHQGLTVYVPPVTARPVADMDLAKKIESLEHLKSVTRARPAAPEPRT